jgi:hypothetical protein
LEPGVPQEKPQSIPGGLKGTAAPDAGQIRPTNSQTENQTFNPFEIVLNNRLFQNKLIAMPA